MVRETDDHMAGDLVRALKSAECAVPEELEAKAAAYWDRPPAGVAIPAPPTHVQRACFSTMKVQRQCEGSHPSVPQS